MQLSLMNPYIRLARQSIIPPAYNFARRIIYDYEIIYLERGEFTLVYDDIPYSCKEGDIIFIRPNISHYFKLDRGEISQPHIHFDITHRLESEKIPICFKDFSDMTDEEKKQIHQDYFSAYPKLPLLRLQSKDAFLNIFYQIISESTPLLLKKALLLQLLAMVIEDNFPALTEEKQLLSVAKQIKDYIDAGNGFKMSLDDFSKSFYQSKFYLEKQFKKEFGVGLIEYRNNKRLERAKSLLQKYSVTKVADDLGYQSIYSFSRAYKNYFGVSPKKSSVDG